MDWHSRSIRIGGAVIVCAILLRLAAVVPGLLLRPGAMSVLLFLETGRLMQQTVPTEPAALVTPPTEESAPVATELPVTQAVFSVADADLVRVNNVCGLETDVAQSLIKNLQWDLTAQAPTVLILHSHGSESYENTEGYTPSAEYRTLDTAYNMVSIGERLTELLEAGGIRVVHDKTLHDVPSYSDSYGNARTSIEAYLEKYPQICLVLDLHRDAAEDGAGKQIKFTVDGQSMAQLMLVVGTNAGGLNHPDWPENMSLAVKLHAQLEKMVPGSCRPISFRSQRFNQDLSPGALIVEVGAAGNTRQEALAATELLADAIVALSRGSTGVKS